MRILKTALIALVTTCVLLPLAGMLIATIASARTGGHLLIAVQGPAFLAIFVGTFLLIFAVAWFLLQRRPVQH